VTASKPTTNRGAVAIAEAFDVEAVKVAIEEAQQLVPGYTYEGLCKKSDACRMCGFHRVMRWSARSVFRPHG